MLDYGATKSSLRAKAPADIGHIVKVETSLPLDGESEFLSRHTDPDTDAIIGTDLLGRFTCGARCAHSRDFNEALRRGGPEGRRFRTDRSARLLRAGPHARRQGPA